MLNDQNPYSAPQTPLQAAPLEALPIVDWLAVPGMRSVARGLALCYYSILILLFCVLGLIVALVMTRTGAIDGEWVFIGFICVAVFAHLLNLVGQGYCVAAPEEFGARRTAWFAFICMLISCALSLGLVAWSQTAIPANLQVLMALNWIVQILWIIGFIAFLVFLKLLAQYFQHPRLIKRANGVLIVFGLTMASFVGCLLFGFTMRPQQLGARPNETLGFLTAGCGLAFLVFMLWLLISYSRTLLEMRRLILRGTVG